MSHPSQKGPEHATSGALPEKVTRFPLTWPTFWKRTPSEARTKADFRESALATKQVWDTNRGSYVDKQVQGTKPVGLPTARERLQVQLDKLGADDIVLSTNLQLTAYGEPRGGMGEPTDPGAAVYFTLGGHSRVLACDRWKTVAQNIAALAAHIDAIRRVDRYGVGTLEQAFAGYDALPAPSHDNRPPWRAILRFPPLTPVSPSDVQVAYRSLARAAATDEARLKELNLARDAALVELGASR